MVAQEISSLYESLTPLTSYQQLPIVQSRAIRMSPAKHVLDMRRNELRWLQQLMLHYPAALYSPIY